MKNKKTQFRRSVDGLVATLWKRSGEGSYVSIAQTPKEIKESLMRSSVGGQERMREFIAEKSQESGIGYENLTFNTGIGDTYEFIMYVPKNPNLYK